MTAIICLALFTSFMLGVTLGIYSCCTALEIATKYSDRANEKLEQAERKLAAARMYSDYAEQQPYVNLFTNRN